MSQVFFGLFAVSIHIVSLCLTETLYSFSHGMVLPPNPAAANLLSPQEAEGDFVSIFSGVEAFSGSEDLDPSLMKSLEWDWPEANGQLCACITTLFARNELEFQ